MASLLACINLSIDIDNYTNYTLLVTGVHDGWMTRAGKMLGGDR
jgi:hypothetical protein